ncbi:MAG: hypothetical protein HY306_03695 [Nitrosomonadales bacterium]|nr:hypothetical protein [Nitrosomonadales bacterium]
MKKLIQLHGVHDSGKTTTIRRVFELLIAEYPAAGIDDQSSGRARKKGAPEVRAILKFA